MEKPILDPKNPKFNWLTALTWSKEFKLTVKEHEDLTYASNRWPTCACGELCKNLPRIQRENPKIILCSGLD